MWLLAGKKLNMDGSEETLESPALESPSNTPEGINVIIPIGGIGSRFAKQGYRFPKPFINIAGFPMLFWIIDRLKVCSYSTRT